MVVWNYKRDNVKDKNGNLITYQKCDGWDWGNPASCNNSKPEGTIGWMWCNATSDPETKLEGSCGGLSSDVSTCGTVGSGLNCYAIQKIEKAQWGGPVTGCDGAGHKLTIKHCTNWTNGDPNMCNDSKPSDVKQWIKCLDGSSPGGIVSGHNAISCDNISNSFPCAKGSNCFGITNNIDDTTCSGVSGKTVGFTGETNNVKDRKGNKISFQKCSGWSDQKTCGEKKPANTKGWMQCSDDTTTPSSGSGWCGDYVEGADNVTQACNNGTSSCFAITDIEKAQWSQEYSGCDGEGHRLKIQKCTNWTNDDPNNCNITKPSGTNEWINCGQGSSPGGMIPGTATACSPISKTFGCAKGQDCYAILDNKDDKTCPDTRDIVAKTLGGILATLGLAALAPFLLPIVSVCVLLLCMCCSSSSILLLK
jgi:hypothetical protein